MPDGQRKPELGRGERLLPGIWRLRLPLPFPGVPHCNAWAVAAGDGIVLFDCGMHEPGSLAHLERAMSQVNLKIEHVRLLVCTHAHADHYGQAADIIDRSGCELWMNHNHRHMTATVEDPDAALARRLEVARHSGVPAETLRRYADAAAGQGSGITRIVMPDRDLVDGVEVETDLGSWRAYETQGHAPSHVCLYQPERRLLISGDHLMGRVSIYLDYGYTPDPAGEFLNSLDIVEALDARLCIPGHGRTFTDVAGHIRANREQAHERLDAIESVLAEHGPLTAFDVAPLVFGEPLTELNVSWRLREALAYLDHLALCGRAAGDGEDPERWATL